MPINWTLEECQEQVGKGWAGLVEKIYKRLPETAFVEQVKEKFGGLRFYVSGIDDDVFDVIREAEEESYITCEECGEPGKLREDLSWILTLCDKHYQARLNRSLWA